MADWDPGPASLGRGAVILAGAARPETRGWPSVIVDEGVLADPVPVVGALYEAWLERVPVVVELGVPADRLRSLADGERTDLAPFEVGPEFLFPLERLLFLVWSNNWDARGAEPIWWWARRASRLGARLSSHCDVVLPDGTEAWCDGGPLQELAELGDLDGRSVVHRSSLEQQSLRVLRSGAAPPDLAPDQLAAVMHDRGPARVIAPAGSGKTRVLTARLTHLLDGRNVHPNVVAAVAYNTRAADELKERVGDRPANIRTLNSLAYALVSGTNGFPRSGFEPQRRTVIEERQVRNILGGLVDLRRRVNTDPMVVWLDAISTTRLALADPAEVEASSPELDGFASVFSRYRELLAARRLIDFDEQIYRAVELLLGDTEFRQAAQQRCRVLLVDEFQDLTPAHMLMLRLLASPALDVFGVGDDDQVIYGYAGADPSFLVDFATWFPRSTPHPLEVNYRCPPAVVDAATTLLTHNRRRVPKNIRPHPQRSPGTGEFEVIKGSVAALPSRAVEKVHEALDAGSPPTEIAVLARVNVTLLPLQVLLHEVGVPTTAPVTDDLLERTGIKAALAYLRMGCNPDAIDPHDIAATIRRPNRRIAKNVSEMLTSSGGTSITDIRRLASKLEGADGPRLAGYAEDLRAVHDAAKRSTSAALHTIRSRVGLAEAMDTLDSSRREADRSTHADDLAALEAVAHVHDDATTFEPWLREVLQRRGDPNGVRLSTIHKVKGREWDNVVVFDASDGLMPHRLATNIEEERRVFHVAITRGRNHVSVLADIAAPSPFLAEMREASRPPPEPQPRRRQAGSTRQGKRRPQERGACQSRVVVAEVGLFVEVPGGMSGEVTIIEDHGVVVRAGRATTTVPFGALVRAKGALHVLAAPQGPNGDGPSSATERAYSVDEKRRDHPKAYEPWSDDEDARLLQEHADGLKLREIAARHGRNEGAIRSRLKKLSGSAS